MKCLLFVFSLFSFCANAQPYFEIRIKQDGETFVPVNNEVSIQKKPFQIEFTLKGVRGVYLYADFADSLYKLKSSQPVPGLSDLKPINAMAMDVYNMYRELVINKEAWSYFHYDKNDPYHPFDTANLKVKGDTVTANKSIIQFLVTDWDRSILITDAKEPLYLFLVATVGVADVPVRERIRQKIKIVWKERHVIKTF